MSLPQIQIQIGCFAKGLQGLSWRRNRIRDVAANVVEFRKRPHLTEIVSFDLCLLILASGGLHTHTSNMQHIIML